MSDNYQPIFEEINHIDYNTPWLFHVKQLLKDKKNYLFDGNGSRPETADILNQLLIKIYPNGLTTGKGKSLKFVPQSVLDDVNHDQPTSYETWIANTGEIPTRNNLHDLFNAWVWLTFPQTKAVLNRHQAEQIENLGVSSERGRLRDAITILDENGAILVTCDQNTGQALQSFDWGNSLINNRQQWDMLDKQDLAHPAQSMVMICGHALFEQLINPRKPLCSHTFILYVTPDIFSLPIDERRVKIDQLLAEKVDMWLSQSDISPRQLSPLPILGIPHFWQENHNLDFYDDEYVFRKGRRKNK